jgi:hypothetical protein
VAKHKDKTKAVLLFRSVPGMLDYCYSTSTEHKLKKKIRILKERDDINIKIMLEYAGKNKRKRKGRKVSTTEVQRRGM